MKRKRCLRKPSKAEKPYAVRARARVDGIYINEISKKNAPVKGVRQTILEIYYSEGILSVYAYLNEYNKKRGYEFFTREMVENWIAEDARKRGNKKDDGFDR